MPTKAEVRALMLRITPSIILTPSEKHELIAVCEDWLRMKAAETTIDAPTHKPGCWSYTAGTLEPPHA